MTGQRRKAKDAIAPKAATPTAPVVPAAAAHSGPLATDIGRLITEARRDAAMAVNATLTLL